MAKLELRLPAEAQGAFIPAGGVFDGFQAVLKAMGTAQKDVLIVDPYADDKLISDFVPLAPEGVPDLRAQRRAKREAQPEAGDRALGSSMAAEATASSATSPCTFAP